MEPTALGASVPPDREDAHQPSAVPAGLSGATGDGPPSPAPAMPAGYPPSGPDGQPSAPPNGHLSAAPNGHQSPRSSGRRWFSLARWRTPVDAEIRNTAPPEREWVFFSWVAVVCLLAGMALAPTIPGLIHFLNPPPQVFCLMAALAVLSDLRPFTPAGRAQVSAVYPSVCFSFAILLGWGLGPAVLVQSAAVLSSALRMRHRLWRAAFNASQYALAYAAAEFMIWLTGVGRFTPDSRPSWLGGLAVLAASVAWFVVNYSLVSVTIWLRFGGSLLRLVRGTAPYEVLATGALVLLAPVLVAAGYVSTVLVPFVLIPLYAVNRMARLSQHQARLARQDPLTGLANRKALEAEVVEALAVVHDRPSPEGALAAGPPARMALLLLDLDRFKHVNDALGHAVGDRLLIQVGLRILHSVRAGDTVARLGGDEFAVLVPRIADLAEARALAGRIADLLAQPVPLDGMPLDVSASVGVAVYPDHGRDFATLMRHADVAMYDAKNRGDAVAVYAPESDHNSPGRLSLLADLRRALDHPEAGQIAFYYQPQVELSTGEVLGVEALLRWQHPERGQVDPEELIRIAEHSAVMRLLTLRVIDDVVAQLAKWQSEGLVLRAAINVSVRDLHTGEIVDRLAERLVHHGVGAGRIQLEITEGALMADPHRVMATLRRLEQLGVALSLDDFGTGYSSMQHLRRLPLSEVKIDRSFVMGMTSDPDDEAIVRSIIELSSALGLRVVAEGVENEGTWRLLAAAGCHVAQGWYYARPMPGDDLASWLSRYRPPQRQLPSWRPGGYPESGPAGRP